MQLLDRNSMGSNTTVALGELFSTRNCIEESKIIQPCPPPHGCHSTYSARVSRNLCFPKPHSLHVSEICALLPAECWSAVRIRFQAFSHHKALNCDGKTTDMDEHVVGILLSRHCCVCARPHDDIQQSATVFPRHPIAPFVSPTLKKLKFKRSLCIQDVLVCSSQLEIPRLPCLLDVPVGRLAGRRTAAASGAVGPFDAARYSQDAADGGGPHAQRPGCNEPAK